MCDLVGDEMGKMRGNMKEILYIAYKILFRFPCVSLPFAQSLALKPILAAKNIINFVHNVKAICLPPFCYLTTV